MSVALSRPNKMNLRQFDLNLLVALDALLAERSVTKAAERLSLSQPAMSGILSRLRHAFGDELLVRVGRSLQPTAFGADLAGPIHEAMQQLQTALNTKRPFVPATENLEFRIAASDFVIMLMLGPIMDRLLDHAPGISLRFSALRRTSVDELLAGHLDFAILPFDPEQDFPFIPLFEETWTCAAWSQHPTVGRSVSLEQFLALPHIIFSYSSEELSLADEHLATLGHPRKFAAATEFFLTGPFLLRGTSLLTILPRRLAQRLQRPADIKLIDLPFDVPPFQERLVWNPRFSASPPHTWMRAQIAEVAKTL